MGAPSMSGTRHTRQHVAIPVPATDRATRPGMADERESHLAPEYRYPRHDYTWGASRKRWAHLVPPIPDEAFLETEQREARRTRPTAARTVPVSDVSDTPIRHMWVAEPVISAHAVARHRRERDAVARYTPSDMSVGRMLDDLLADTQEDRVIYRFPETREIRCS